MKTKIIGVLSAILFFSSAAYAQDYKRAVGLNVGAIVGVNYKEFISSGGAFDVVFGYDVPKNGVMLTAVYQHHVRLLEGFNFYAGGGLNIGFGHASQEDYFVIGVDPTVGFEYKFKAAPVALALDYAPQINITSSMDWRVAALKIRFTL